MFRTSRRVRATRVAAAVALTALASTAGRATDRPDADALVGRAAPVFTAAGLDGDSLSLADLRGDFALLNFWGPACPPCIAESPHLRQLHRKYAKRGLRIVGVTQMNPKRADIEKFLRKKRITYTIVLDPGEAIGKRYAVAAHPTSVLVGPDGIVRWVRAGYLDGDEKELEAAVVRALDEHGRP
jgi:peroxiredoxin